MKKYFSNFKISNYLVHQIICLLYPVAKTFASQNKLVALSDSSLIVSLMYLLFGVLYSFILHGDLDITEFIAKRAINSNKPITFEKFKEEKKIKREGSINYPLLVGIITLLFSILISYLV